MQPGAHSPRLCGISHLENDFCGGRQKYIDKPAAPVVYYRYNPRGAGARRLR